MHHTHVAVGMCQKRRVDIKSQKRCCIHQKRNTNIVSNKTYTRQMRHTKETCKHRKRITNIVSNQTYIYQKKNVFNLYICTHTSLFTYNTIFVCLFWCIYIYTYMYVYVCMYACVHICIYICSYISIYTVNVTQKGYKIQFGCVSDVYMLYVKRDVKRDVYTSKETCIHQKRNTKEMYKYIWACELYDSVKYMCLWNICCLCCLYL